MTPIACKDIHSVIPINVCLSAIHAHCCVKTNDEYKGVEEYDNIRTLDHCHTLITVLDTHNGTRFIKQEHMSHIIDLLFISAIYL